MFKQLLTIVILNFFSVCVNAQTTFYVDAARSDNTGAGTSWATAKKDLQVAINLASSGDQIWVKAGTYLPTHDPFANTAPANNRDKTFTLINGVKVYGGFAGTETLLSQRNWQTNITTLSGDLGVINTLSDNAYHVVLSVNLTNTTILDGFAITKGYATAVGGSSITVGGRVISRFKGGAMYNTFSGSNFNNCRFTESSADCTDSGDDSWGAGIVADQSTSTFTDCSFENNSFLNSGGSFGVFGSGACIINGTCSFVRCVFAGNTSGSGFFDGSRGGAMNISGGATSITNCIFYNNTSQNGAGIAFSGATGNTTTVTYCSFASNTSSFAGTAFSGFAKAVFRNCILWNNTPTSSSVTGRNEVYSQETNTANFPSFINCIIRDATGSPLSVTNTVCTNVSNSNPLFVNTANAIGGDNRWASFDDGLKVDCTSPALNYGVIAAVVPASDILNNYRSDKPTLGAYELSKGVEFSLPTAATIIVRTQNGTTIYGNCSTNLLALVLSNGASPISGSTTAKVWIESTQPSQFVRRHYEITPATGASTATGKVTLFFTQADFDAFNAVSNIDLPTGPNDIANKGNLLIEKRPGVSNNSTGLPNTYTGTPVTINPADGDIVWNAFSSRWEVTFDVTGFSGFFVKTQVTVLPLRLLNFSASEITGCNKLQWQTANEVNTKEFVIEKSDDAITFQPIAVKAAIGTGDNAYYYKDCSMTASKQYYRLKMIDNDGSFSYSSIVKVENKQNLSVSVSPNPATDVVVISATDNKLLNTTVSIVDVNGRILMQPVITNLPYRFHIKSLPVGLYFLHFSNGQVLKLLHQK